MPVLRAALLSTALLAASTAAAQSTPAAPQVTRAPTSQASPAPLPTPVEGGEAAPPAAKRYGLGVSLGGRSWDPTLYVPIDMNRTRFEFELAFADGSAGEANASSAHLGVGLFRLVPTSPGIRAYLGGRFQYLHLGGAGSSTDGLRAAFALGGEWAPAPMFAIGVEGQVGYTASTGSTEGVDTTALAFIRVFLGTFESSEKANPARGKAGTEPAARCSQDRDCSGLDVCVDGVCRR